MQAEEYYASGEVPVKKIIKKKQQACRTIALSACTNKISAGRDAVVKSVKDYIGDNANAEVVKKMRDKFNGADISLICNYSHQTSRLLQRTARCARFRFGRLWF